LTGCRGVCQFAEQLCQFAEQLCQFVAGSVKSASFIFVLFSLKPYKRLPKFKALISLVRNSVMLLIFSLSLFYIFFYIQ